jgi:hypothetical protein
MSKQRQTTRSPHPEEQRFALRLEGRGRQVAPLQRVMPGLVPGIHAGTLRYVAKEASTTIKRRILTFVHTHGADTRDKRGHDAVGRLRRIALVLRDAMLRIAPKSLAGKRG